MKKLFFIFFLLVWAYEAKAATKFVRKTGADGARTCTNTGADACLTIAYGIGKLSAGDTLDIGAGVYIESIDDSVVTLPNSGSWSNPTTIKKDPNAAVDSVILRPTSTVNGTISLSHSHFVIFDGLQIDNNNLASGDHNNADVYGTSSSIKIINSNLLNSNLHGIIIKDQATDVSILTSKIHDTRGGCAAIGPGLCHGIYQEGTNAVLDGNEIYNIISGAGIHQYNGGVGNLSGIYRNNRIHNTGIGMLLWDGGASEVYNNLIWSNLDAIWVGQNSSGLKIYENTIWNNTGGQGLGCVYATVATTVRNNICYANAGGDLLGVGSFTQSGNTFNATDPLFASTTPGNANFLKLSTGSPAINNGADLGVTYNRDINGVLRPQETGWDIGAFEYEGTVPEPSGVFVTGPTSSPRFSINASSTQLSGIANSSVPIVSIIWSNDKGGSGSAQIIP